MKTERERPTRLDTNVPSELLRPDGDPNVGAFVETLGNPFISDIVFHELSYGVEMLPAGVKKARLGAGIETFRNRFLKRTVFVETEIAGIAGRLRAGQARSGFARVAPDALIAATADTLAARLATKNIRHFERMSLDLVNPWTL